MQNCFAKLWRWMKRGFVRTPKLTPSPPPHEISDLEYENHLMALLEQVAEGRTWGMLQGFLASRNVDKNRLTQWLQGFGERWLTQAGLEEQELARRLRLLGEVATGELAEVAKRLSERLSASPPGTSSGIAVDTEPKLQPNDHEACFNRGVALKELGQLEEAIASFDQALKLQPNDHQAWFGRGVALYELGQLEEVIASFDQALKLQPNDHEAWYNRGVALYKLGQFEEAIASFDQTLELQPNLHQAWYNRGLVLKKLGQFEEAIASFDQALKLQPNDHEAWDNRGIVLYELGQLEEAIASFDQALKLQPNHHQAWYNRGIALYELGQLEEAIASFDQALKLQPNLHQAWLNRGAALYELGQLEEAIASYDQALKLQPNLHQAWLNRGIVLYELGQLEEAIASYDQALKLQPNFHQAWLNRGAALKELGQLEEAIASYDQALKLQPNYHLAWLNRGIAAKASSSPHSTFEQQQFIERFRLEVNNAPQKIISALQAIDSAQRLAQFQAFLNTSTQQLLATFANLEVPQLIAQIQQSPPPQLGELIQQSSPPQLIAQIQQPFDATVLAQIEQDFLHHPPKFNPQLNWRGYQGALASYQAELDKAIRRDTDPQGWGKLHYAIGKEHYSQGRQNANPSSFWRKAEDSYNTALQALKPPNFEELHLEVLQDLIWVLLDLREIQKAQQLQREGTSLLQRMLDDPNRTQRKKRQLALKFAGFNQLTVDIAIQGGNIAGALTLAETGKNTCLRWLLDIDEIPAIDYAQIQQLLTTTTAAIYWHLSPASLTTFVIFAGASAPILIPSSNNLVEADSHALQLGLDQSDQRGSSVQQLLAWESWLRDWNQAYGNYASSKDKQRSAVVGDKQQHPWRTQMQAKFEHLQQILNIRAIAQELQSQGIQHLILIPHRDLHRFPLHLFFDNLSCSYLPSAHMGIKLSAKTTIPTSLTQLSSLLIVENPQSTPQVNDKPISLELLPFAEVESALVRQFFYNAPIAVVENQDATLSNVQQALTQSHQIFHFTGHGAYNSANPAQSCLFLSGTDQLTLLEIIRLDLSSYRLVCLAACETAVTGNQTITDEYVGLVSAFLKAGADYVVSTLWKVESFTTTLVLMEFYQQLQAGQPPAVALQSAQMWLKNATRDQLIQSLDDAIARIAQFPEDNMASNTKKSLQLVLKDQCKIITMNKTQQPYSHPYYWAAFTISGL